MIIIWARFFAKMFSRNELSLVSSADMLQISLEFSTPEIFSDLKLCLATAIHNLKSLKINSIYKICATKNITI